MSNSNLRSTLFRTKLGVTALGISPSSPQFAVTEALSLAPYSHASANWVIALLLLIIVIVQTPGFPQILLTTFAAVSIPDLSFGPNLTEK
jgi:hypothetical protein